MNVRFWLESGAFAPTKAHKEDAGFDIRTPEFFTVKPRESVFIDTGLHVEIPVGYVGMIKSKSGLNKNNNILVEGVVDAGYSGSIGLKVYNHSDYSKSFDIGDKVTQLVILPIPEVEMVEEYFTSEGRGSNGFGSSGV